MNIAINIIDYVSFLVLIIAFLFLLLGWKRILLRLDVKFLFAVLLVFSTFHNLMNILEWSSGINQYMDVLENNIAILNPVLWGFFFYSFLQCEIEREFKKRDRRLQELFDEAPVGYHELDTEGRITRVNNTELKMLGYTSNEMLGHYVWDFTQEPDLSKKAVIEKIKRKSLLKDSFERNYKLKDGTITQFLIKDKLLTNEEGEVIGIRSTIQDITDRKQYIERLKESEEFSWALFEYNPIETIVVNTKGEIINFNLPQRKSGGRLPHVRDIMYKDYAKQHEIDMYAELMQCIGSGKTKTFPDQKYKGRILTITIAPFPQGAIITSRDVTEQKLAEEEVKKLSSVVEQATDGISIADLKRGLIYVNNAFAKMHGYSPEEMLGMEIENLHNPEQSKEVNKYLKQIETKGVWEGEVFHTRKDGSTFPTYMSAILLRNDKGEPIGMSTVCRDISERKFIEEALRSSEERYRELWDNAPVAYHTLDTKGIITSVNHTEAKMLGYKPEEILGKPIFNFILPEQKAEAKERFLQKIKGNHVPEAKDRIYVTKTGRKIHVNIDDVWEYDENKKIIGVRTTMVDITDRKKAEEEREKSFKQLQRSFEETIAALVSAVEIRDLYTAGHQKRVTEIACAIAKEMNLSNNQIVSIRMAGLVHDIGKIAIPTEILGKPAKLTENEMDLVRTHVMVGYDILKTVEFPGPVAQIVLQHHERINGSGYPKGLKGDEILIEAKILSVADVVEAIATYRPYHEAFGIDIALEEISKNKGILYDPSVVNTCIKLFKEKHLKLEIGQRK